MASKKKLKARIAALLREADANWRRGYEKGHGHGSQDQRTADEKGLTVSRPVLVDYPANPMLPVTVNMLKTRPADWVAEWIDCPDCPHPCEPSVEQS